MITQAYGNWVIQKEMGNIKCECQVVGRRSWCQQVWRSPGSFSPHSTVPVELKSSAGDGYHIPIMMCCWTTYLNNRPSKKDMAKKSCFTSRRIPRAPRVSPWDIKWLLHCRGRSSKGENQCGSGGVSAARWVCTHGVCGRSQRTSTALSCFACFWIELTWLFMKQKPLVMDEIYAPHISLPNNNNGLKN